jgi:hypothetical protein
MDCLAVIDPVEFEAWNRKMRSWPCVGNFAGISIKNNDLEKLFERISPESVKRERFAAVEWFTVNFLDPSWSSRGPEQNNLAPHFLRLTETNFWNNLADRRAIRELSSSQVEIIKSIPGTRKDPMLHFQSLRLLLGFSDLPYLTIILRDKKLSRDDKFRARLCLLLARPIPRHPDFSPISGSPRSRVQITHNTILMDTDNCWVIQGSEIRNFGDSVKILPQSTDSQFLTPSPWRRKEDGSSGV